MNPTLIRKSHCSFASLRVGAAAPEQQLYIIGKLPMIYNLFFCMPDTKEKKQMLKQKPP